MPRGLAPKLILSVTAIALLVEGGFAFVNARIQERQLLHEVVLRADELSNTITRATWHLMLADHRESAYEVMNTISRQEGVQQVRIFNKQGLITFSTGVDAGRQVDLTAEACDLCHQAGKPLVRVQEPSRVRFYHDEDGHHLLGMVTPIYNEAACAPCHSNPQERPVLGVLDISVPLSRVDREVEGIRMRAVLVAGVSVLLIGVFVVLFTRRFVTKPVRALIGATRQVAEMDLNRPVEVDSRDEIGDLGRSFNDMRERLLQARREIEDFTRNLERMVAERTAELETAQQRLIQSDRLASLGRLAASVAHEVNNPISGVLNFGMLMRRLMTEEGVPPERTADFRRYLEQVVTEATRAGKIVSDLLSFARRSPRERSPVDLNELVLRTLSVTEHRISDSGAVVETKLALTLPPVPCEAVRIQQVITNLLLNAAEAGHVGARITVATRREDEHVVLEVADEGEGIPEKNLGRIFDPFFTTKEESKGIGLGLAVSYGIVQAHGGEIEVRSEVGKGTTFTVRLPLRPPAADPARSEEA